MSESDTDTRAGLGVLAAACVSALIVNANTSAVTILLPAISDDLGTPAAQLQWAVAGYMLVGAAVIVTSGALADVLGRRVFLAGLALFVASCGLIALSRSGGAVIAGRMIQGAAGSTILACGMSLLSVGSSGAGQLRAITLWGAASAAGAAAGPLVGGVLVDTTGWQGLFWINAAVAAACVPLTWLTVQESRDPRRPRSIDFAGTVLMAVILVPLVLALSEGADWGWGSVATIAILIVAGAINALMYLLSLYFQDPAAFGMSALEAGLATLPAAAAIAVTPFITPVAVKLGTRAAVVFGLAAVAFGALAFVDAAWSYAAFVLPLVVIAVGLGLANGPASSASTASVARDEVGQASGISNMARYIGGSLAVAAVATVSSAVSDSHRRAGASAADALAAGLSRSALLLALVSGGAVALAVLMGRHRAARPRAVDRAAAAAVST
jgi:predicted MFS family arabinose efflux permease